MLYNSHNLFFFFDKYFQGKGWWHWGSSGIRSKKLSPWEWGFPEPLQSNNDSYLGTGLGSSSNSVLPPPEACCLLVFPSVGIFKASMELWRGWEGKLKTSQNSGLLLRFGCCSWIKTPWTVISLGSLEFWNDIDFDILASARFLLFSFFNGGKGFEGLYSVIPTDILQCFWQTKQMRKQA